MHPNITLTQLRCLCAVAERGSFTAAASALHLTQSAISQNVAAVERELGSKLVIRARGALALTTSGVLAVKEARLALAAIDRLAAVTESADALRGVLRLGVVQSAAVRLLPGWIRRLRTTHPRVTVSLYEGTDPEVLDWVLSGVIDIGIASRTHGDLDAREVHTDSYLVVAPAHHRFAQRAALGLHELDGERMLMSGGGCETLIQQLLITANSRPEIVCMVRDNTTLCGMVREGLGLTLMPELALPEDRTGLAIVPLQPDLRRTLNLLSRSQAALGPIAAAFLSVASVSGEFRAQQT